MAYQVSDPEHYAPPDPPRPTEADMIREELEECPARVEWMGLSLWVACDEGGKRTIDAKPARITWTPDRDRKMAESAAFAEIYHPHLGRQIHDPETYEACQSCVVDGIDPTDAGVFGELLSAGDFQQVAEMGWSAAREIVKKREARKYAKEAGK
jgi:hypothetical protein